MDLWDIAKTVGAGIVSTMVPGGAAIIAGINAFLPEDKQLPEDATGDQIKDMAMSLPPEQRAELMGKQYDVQIEQIKQSHSSLQAMLAANAVSTHTTRPKIAYQAWQVVGTVTLLFAFGWFYAVITGDTAMLDSIKDSYMFVGFLLAPLIVWLNAYFGILREESKDRFNAAQGHKANPVSGLLSKLLKLDK